MSGVIKKFCNLQKSSRCAYARATEKYPVNKKYIFYEAFGGRGMLCNPHALFLEFLKRADFEKYIHIWALEDFEDNRKQIEKYAEYKNVHFVQYDSRQYAKYLAQAGFLINNVAFPGYFAKRKDQTYINTWHGISLKTVGFDVPDSNVNAGNSVRNLPAADYLISADDHMTQIYKKAYKLEGFGKQKILEAGQPRNDLYFHTVREEIFRDLKEAGVDVDMEKKIILYAPTWRGEKYGEPDTDLGIYLEMIETVRRQMDPRKYQILVKPHQIVYRHIRNSGKLTGEFVPATIDTNELLSVTDVLISDYSSIYFDYLVSGKPILFFVPDMKAMENGRGLYFGREKLPGPVAENFEELAGFLEDIKAAVEPFRERYGREQKWACPVDDGNVCRRILEKVFDGKDSCKVAECTLAEEKRKSTVLLWAGTMKAGKKTEEISVFLEKVDREKLDVTVLAENTKVPQEQERINRIPGKIRVFYKRMSCNGTVSEIIREKLFEKINAGNLPLGKLIKPGKGFYEREASRLFGKSTFDYILVFPDDSLLYREMTRYMSGNRIEAGSLAEIVLDNLISR